ncbi:MAG: sigma-70 family RNA polymerase sigma factor [Acidobacteriota bacterium]|jgi:RNA polymerase sigma-70 factor (ECF subfamily)
MNTGFPDELALNRYEENCLAMDQEHSHAPAAEVFEEIFNRYQSMVFNLTFRILGDREEALDVSQEVFFSVFRKLHHFRGESSLKTWIYRITINRASNRCRWWNRLRRRGTISLDEHLSKDDSRTLSDSLESAGNTPEQDLVLQEQRLEIERSLRRLPVQQRVAVIMRDVEGLSYDEIAGLLQVSLGTVKSRIARGREELKRRLNGTLG